MGLNSFYTMGSEPQNKTRPSAVSTLALEICSARQRVTIKSWHPERHESPSSRSRPASPSQPPPSPEKKSRPDTGCEGGLDHGAFNKHAQTLCFPLVYLILICIRYLLVHSCAHPPTNMVWCISPFRKTTFMLGKPPFHACGCWNVGVHTYMDVYINMCLYIHVYIYT